MAYKAGVCNIGKRERAKRRLVGMLGLASSCITYLIIILSSLPWFAAITVILPLFMMTIGFNQSINSFCIQLAFEGRCNFTDNCKVSHKDHLKDRSKAWIMLLQSFAVALIIDLVLIFFMVL